MDDFKKKDKKKINITNVIKDLSTKNDDSNLMYRAVIALEKIANKLEIITDNDKVRLKNEKKKDIIENKKVNSKKEIYETNNDIGKNDLLNDIDLFIKSTND